MISKHWGRGVLVSPAAQMNANHTLRYVIIALVNTNKGGGGEVGRSAWSLTPLTQPISPKVHTHRSTTRSLAAVMASWLR
jgi:hypothetical protein